MGIYKRKQENDKESDQENKKERKKTRTRPRKRSRKQEKKKENKNSTKKKEILSFFLTCLFSFINSHFRLSINSATERITFSKYRYTNKSLKSRHQSKHFLLTVHYSLLFQVPILKVQFRYSESPALLPTSLQVQIVV